MADVIEPRLNQLEGRPGWVGMALSLEDSTDDSWRSLRRTPSATHRRLKNWWGIWRAPTRGESTSTTAWCIR